MKVDQGESLSRIFHENSKNRNYRWEGPELPPSVWKRVYFKSYPRMQEISLDDAKQPEEADLRACIKKRRSHTDYLQEALSKEEISFLLRYSVGITKPADDQDDTRRAFPSGGARYPTEVYLVLLSSQELSEGLYHYNVKNHSLKLLAERDFLDRIKSSLLTENIDLDTISAVFILTAVFARSQAKYGERGYRYILLEAGHIAQNFYLTSESLDLGACEVGGFVDDSISDFLGIKKENEEPITAVVVGKPERGEQGTKSVSTAKRVR